MGLRIVGTWLCGLLVASAAASAPGRVEHPIRCKSGIERGPLSERPVRISLNGHLGRVSALAVVAAGKSQAVDGMDGRVLAEAGPGARWSVTRGDDPERSARCTLRGEGQEQTFAVRTLRIEARDGETLRVISGRVERVYPGVIEIQSGKNSLTVINEAPLEQYIQGVVAAEGSPRWHPEALKALAVAARSYTERNRGRHGAAFDLCDTTHCHCYAGLGSSSERVREAVTVTAGTVALYDGRPIDAVYSADCGGRTQTVHDAWGSKREIAYLKSVVDSPEVGGPDYCSINPKHTWSRSLSAAELERLLNRRSDTRVGRLKRVEVVSTTDSGRPAEIEIVGGNVDLPADLDRLPCEIAEERGAPGERAASDGTSADPGLVVLRLPVTQFLEILDEAMEEQSAARSQSPALRVSSGGRSRSEAASAPSSVGPRPRGSSMIELRPLPGGGLAIEARGSGHGVGLCQYGAQAMAARYGKSWQEILRHYYAGVEFGAAP